MFEIFPYEFIFTKKKYHETSCGTNLISVIWMLKLIDLDKTCPIILQLLETA